jgi:hypothetical protein
MARSISPDENRSKVNNHEQIQSSGRFIENEEKQQTWDKGVLRASINERNIFQNTSNTKQGGRRNLRLISVHSSKKVLCGVIESNNQITVPLCVSSP